MSVEFWFLCALALVGASYPYLLASTDLAERVQKAGVPIPIKKGEFFFDPTFKAVDELSRNGRIHISVCASGQFSAYADDTRRLLQENFPDVQVELTNYVPPPVRESIMKLVSALQGSLVMLTLIGPSLFAALGFERTPAVLEWMNQHRIVSIAILWLGGNMIQSGLITTGAFEIFCDGNWVFSRLAQERLPTFTEIIERVRELLPVLELH